jgi:hypothetical protein
MQMNPNYHAKCLRYQKKYEIEKPYYDAINQATSEIMSAYNNNIITPAEILHIGAEMPLILAKFVCFKNHFMCDDKSKRDDVIIMLERSTLTKKEKMVELINNKNDFINNSGSYFNFIW